MYNFKCLFTCDTAMQVIHSQFNFRLSISPLEKTSLEDEIFNTTIDGHDGDEPHNEHTEGGTESITSTGYTSTVEEVTPELAIKMEKCIVFSHSCHC